MTSLNVVRQVGIISIAIFSLFISLLSATTAHAAAISVQSISPGTTLLVGQTLTFSAIASSDLGSTPIFLVFDDKSGSSLTSSAINATSSAFSWTPTTADLGKHTLSVEATNGQGLIAISDLVITVVSTSTPITSTTSTTSTAATSSSSIAAYVNPNSAIVPLGAPATTTSTAVSQTTTSPVSVQSTTVSSSSGLSYLQNTAIAAILRSFGVSEGLINQVLALLSNSTTVTSSASASASSGAYLFTSLLTEGSNGKEVTELQKRLSALGYFSGTPSGTFGPQTTLAVKAFQKAKGIAQLGYVGPSTRNALNGQ